MKVGFLILVALAVLGIICYFWLFPRHTFVSIYGERGRGLTLSRKGVSLEKPAQFYPSNGFARVESYISRLVQSQNRIASVIIATSDGQHAVLVTRRSNQMLISLSADIMKGNAQETLIREYFSKLSMLPARDYLSANGKAKNAVRNLVYPLRGGPKEVALLCISIFKDLFGVSDESGLEFDTDGF